MLPKYQDEDQVEENEDKDVKTYRRDQNNDEMMK